MNIFGGNVGEDKLNLACRAGVFNESSGVHLSRSPSYMLKQLNNKGRWGGFNVQGDRRTFVSSFAQQNTPALQAKLNLNIP